MSVRTPLDLLVTHAALSQMVQQGDLIESICEEEVPPKFASQLKNVCAKVSVQLSDEIDSICGFLGISKRKFLEAAFIEAVDKAHRIIDAEGVHDYYERMTQDPAKAKGAKK